MITKTGKLLFNYINELVEVKNNTINIIKSDLFLHIPQIFGFERYDENDSLGLITHYIGEYGHYYLGLDTFIVKVNFYVIRFKTIYVESINDKSAIDLMTLNNKIFSKRWYKNGILHRDNDKPTILEKITSETHFRLITWHQNGVLHRDNNKPSYLEFWGNGEIAIASWYNKGIMVANLNLNKGGIIESILIDKTYSNNDDFYIKQVKNFDLDSIMEKDEIKKQFNN